MEHSPNFPDSFFRVSVKGLYVRDGKILLVRESTTMSGKWELPGGGLDFGENIEEGLRREIKEEMGLNVTKVSDKPFYVWTYRYENNRRNIGWYYSLVVAYRIELESLDFTPSEECEALTFFSKPELKNIELSHQTNVLRDVFDSQDFDAPF